MAMAMPMEAGMAMEAGMQQAVSLGVKARQLQRQPRQANLVAINQSKVSGFQELVSSVVP